MNGEDISDEIRKLIEGVVSLKEKFLQVDTYQEFDKRRAEFKGLNLQDAEILKHLKELFPKVDNTDFKNGIITEVYKKHPDVNGDRHQRGRRSPEAYRYR